jgi:elongation factor 1-delta
VKRVGVLEEENKELKKIVKDLEHLVNTLTSRVAALEHGSPSSAAKPAAVQQGPAVAANHEKAKVEADDEEDFELFGSDEEEDAEADRVKEERLKAYEAKKTKKPVLIAKSNIILDVKPWDDETDMVELEKCVRTIEMDGLLWGASKLVPLAYGIKKLQISCVVEDDKVSTDDLEEKITAFEDYIQSMDIAAFNKV